MSVEAPSTWPPVDVEAPNTLPDPDGACVQDGQLESPSLLPSPWPDPPSVFVVVVVVCVGVGVGVGVGVTHPSVCGSH